LVAQIYFKICPQLQPVDGPDKGRHEAVLDRARDFAKTYGIGRRVVDDAENDLQRDERRFRRPAPAFQPEGRLLTQPQLCVDGVKGGRYEVAELHLFFFPIAALFSF